MNSPLVSYISLSPHRTKRDHDIDTATIHVTDGDLTLKRLGEVFQGTRQASSNYGIDSAGRIACYVPEDERAMTSSNRANDMRSVTVEVCNKWGKETGYKVTDAALEAIIVLYTDVCRRNSIPKLVWSNNKTHRVNHRNGCNMTVHRDFSAKACPGDYLYSKMPYIAEEVNKRLNSTDASENPINEANTKPQTYTVVKGDTLSAIGKKLNVPWQTIASKNGIKSPYIIRVGQVLKID